MLDTAVNGLRRAGQQDDLPRGLLARASLWQVMKDYPKAHDDLNEAWAITEQGGMRLFEADTYLALVRLSMDEGNREEAREYLETAREMVTRMKYGRRFEELAELEKVFSIA